MTPISDKKKAIFASTLELIKTNGFHGTPISLVVKNAGVAAGTVYHYFDSKDELICELFAYNRCRMIEIIDTTLAEDASYKETFFNIYTKLYDFYIQNTNVLIFFEQFVNSPYNSNKKYPHAQSQLQSFFIDGIEKGYIKSIKPEILKILTLGSIATTAKLNIYGENPLADYELKQIVELFWDGISRN
ncbi:MAG: TetR/AcrR family transcriptional regulator [Balneolales bacterium]